MANWITTEQGKHINLDLYQSIEEYYEGKKFPQLYLPKTEYLTVKSCINEDFYKRYEGKKTCVYFSGNAFLQADQPYSYIFINNGFNEYYFIDKIEIYDEMSNYYKKMLGVLNDNV